MIVNGKRGAIRAAVVLAVVPWACPVVPAQDAYIETMRFAAEMAKRGNWREAKYRWDKAELLEPGNPRVLNNQAVALEAMGDSEGARKLYIRSGRMTTASV